MDVWRYYQPNPKKRNTGDCSVRAISKALGVDWETAYILTADAGLILADMPDNNSVIGGLLQRNGFRRAVVPNTCPDCYTFRDFALDNPWGTFVLGTGTHVATVQDGFIYDSYDSSEKVPIYVWYRDIPPSFVRLMYD